MSSGFVLGEFVAVAELCERLWKQVVVVARSAPKELAGLDKDLAQLNSLLGWLRDEIQDPRSLLNRSGAERIQMVNQTRDSIHDVLRKLSHYADKHRLILFSNDRSKFQQMRDKLKYVPDATAIASVRSKLTYYYGIIQLLMTCVHNSSLERIEQHNQQVTTNIEAITAQLDSLVLKQNHSDHPQNISPLLSVVIDSDIRDMLSQLFMEQAEFRENWQAIGLDTWLQCGTWWLAKAQSVDIEWAISTGDHDNLTQAYTNLLKASWIFLDVLSVHPLVLSSTRGSQQLQIRQFSNTVKSLLDQFMAAAPTTPNIHSLEKSDLTIWSYGIEQRVLGAQQAIDAEEHDKESFVPSTALKPTTKPFYSNVCSLLNGSLRQEALVTLLYGRSEDWTAKVIFQNAQGNILQMFDARADEKHPYWPRMIDGCTSCYFQSGDDKVYISFTTVFDCVNFLAHCRALYSLNGRIPDEYITVAGRFHASMELYHFIPVKNGGGELCVPQTLSEILLPSKFCPWIMNTDSSDTYSTYAIVAEKVNALFRQATQQLRKAQTYAFYQDCQRHYDQYCRLLWIGWISMQRKPSGSNNCCHSTAEFGEASDVGRELLCSFRSHLSLNRTTTFADTASNLQQWRLIDTVFSPMLNASTDVAAYRSYYVDTCSTAPNSFGAQLNNAETNIEQMDGYSRCLYDMRRSWSKNVNRLFFSKSIEDFDAEVGSLFDILSDTLRSHLLGSPACVSIFVNGVRIARDRVEGGSLPNIASWFGAMDDGAGSKWRQKWSALEYVEPLRNDYRASFAFSDDMAVSWLYRLIFGFELNDTTIRTMRDVDLICTDPWLAESSIDGTHSHAKLIWETCAVFHELESLGKRSEVEEELHRTSLGLLQFYLECWRVDKASMRNEVSLAQLREVYVKWRRKSTNDASIPTTNEDLQ